MNDAQRYRMNAAECLSAAGRCELAYRDLTLAIAEAWLSLARQQVAMDELLAIWSKANSATSAASSRQHLQYPCEPGRRQIVAFQAREASCERQKPRLSRSIA